MEWFNEAMRTLLPYCASHGLKPPFIVCIASPNGWALVRRVIPGYTESSIVTLVEHNPSGTWEPPLGGVLLDQSGQSLKLVFNAEGFGYEPIPKTVH